MRHAFHLAIGLGALLAGAPARASDNPACAQYQEPLAYNACLARLGPHAPAAKAVAAPGDDAGAPRAYGRRAASRIAISTGRRGRKRIEFDVGGRRGQP